VDSTVSSYITALSNGEADPTTAEMGQFYEDVLGKLAAREPPILTTYYYGISPSSGIVAYPSAAVKRLLVFFNSKQIGELSLREANWLDPNWRSDTGTPIAFVQESYGSRNFQLVPVPTSGSAALVASYVPSGSLPAWLQMPIALLMLYEEYRRESNHQNVTLANACRSLGELMIAIVQKPIDRSAVARVGA